MKRLLFICTGNICRSPTAEAVFRHKITECGVADRFFIDSAGTQGYHIGEPPDQRSIMCAARRGVSMHDLRARKLEMRDFADFDLLLSMDRGHLEHLEHLRPVGSRGRAVLFLDYHPAFRGHDVPDPYYGTAQGFEDVYDLVEQTASHLLETLLKQE